MNGTVNHAPITSLLSGDPKKVDRPQPDTMADKGFFIRTLDLCLQGNWTEALAALAPLGTQCAATHLCEIGRFCAEQDDHPTAFRAFLKAVELDSNHAPAWRALGDEYAFAGNSIDADKAYAAHIRVSAHHPLLLRATAALCAKEYAVAEELLQNELAEDPRNIMAIRLMAEVGMRLGRHDEAERLLERAVELAPTSRFNYANILYRQNKPQEALAEVEKLLKQDPHNRNYRNLLTELLSRLGETTPAIAVQEQILQDWPEDANAWLSYGHLLRTCGRRRESEAAYHQSLACRPAFGEAYWSLANLKTYRFSLGEVEAMRIQLERRDLTDEDRFHLHFALGKALEDENNYPQSFAHYQKGNALRRAGLPYSPDQITELKNRLMGVFTKSFFNERASGGSSRADPIFIVGLPRSGSTLIEQILSSHSTVEGTMELPDIAAIAGKLGSTSKPVQPPYPEAVQTMELNAFKALGEAYIEQTAGQRKLGRAYFIDKAPRNFLYIGLIHLILPNAKIIDARRHPLGSGFSNFKQHFARGQAFSYDLADIGRYYADYVELMDHFDTVLPGRVHRVFYERLVLRPEEEVRALLNYCGLPFEEDCLRFFENDRPVRSASSEQVRVPFFSGGLEHWKNYEPWLQPLKEALGPLAHSYPDF